MLGLGPIRKDRPEIKHFVTSLKDSGSIDEEIFSIYISPDDHYKSALMFGDYDKNIETESKAKYDKDLTMIKIK